MLPDLINGKLPRFTSIGCYPLFYITKRCDVLCAECATESLADPDDPATDCDANWEDPDLFCDGCSKRIESAYAEAE